MQIHDILRQDPEVWRLFSCAEEYEIAFRDGYDRFPHYVSSNREPFRPRASQYLVLGAKSRAALAGRFTPSIEDVNAVAASVLRHRIVTNFNAEAEGMTPSAIVAELIKAL